MPFDRSNLGWERLVAVDCSVAMLALILVAAGLVMVVEAMPEAAVNSRLPAPVEVVVAVAEAAEAAEQAAKLEKAVLKVVGVSSRRVERAVTEAAVKVARLALQVATKAAAAE